MSSLMQSTMWSDKYIKLAKEISTWSKDPSTKIGAVVVGADGQILSQGFNGFPRGIKDSEERLNNRERKYELVVHGEMNAIYNASLNGVSLKDSTIYVYGYTNPVDVNSLTRAVRDAVGKLDLDSY